MPGIAPSLEFEFLRLFGMFAVCGLVLTLTALIGLVGYNVTRRKREMGIRVVLGATPRAVLSLMLRSHLKSVALGGAVGCLLAIATAARFADLTTKGLSPFDWDGATLVVLFLLGIAAAIVYSITTRATLSAPNEVLRSD